MEQWKKLLSSLSVRQRAMIVVTAVAVAAMTLGFSRWRQDTNFVPLFTGMAAEDAGAVMQRLKEGTIEYRLKEGDGTTILVPSEHLAEVRLQMAGAGLPKSGRAGFELFDRTNLGTTDFAEHINYARAIEGELERSIRYIREVDQARVHLTFPKDSVFVESKQPAKASVLLQLKRGARISHQNVVAICHLVSSAVEGLTPDAVSIVDASGTLLSKPKRQGLEADMPDAAAEYREKLERDMLGKIHTTLEPLLGADRFRASVAVECDLTSGEEREEKYDPEQTVMLTSTRTEESSGGSGTAGGVPGTASSLPRPAKPGSGGSSSTRRSESISYQPSKLVRHTRIPQGAVKRVSVALLIDHTVRWDNQAGKQVRTLTPPAAETLKSVRELVSAVMGLSTERGDQLVVETLPFESTLNANRDPEPVNNPAAPPPAQGFPGNLPFDLKDTRVLIGAGVAAVLVLAGLAFGLKRMLRRKKGSQTVTADVQPQLGPAAEKSSVDGAVDEYKKQLETGAEQKRKMLAEAQEKLKVAMPTEKAEVLVGYLRESVQKDAATAATAIRQWLHE